MSEGNFITIVNREARQGVDFLNITIGPDHKSERICPPINIKLRLSTAKNLAENILRELGDG